MKRLALLLVFTFALVFAPTGAFAKDKHKKHRDRHCDDRRYSSYRSDYHRHYDRGYYGRSYDRGSCYNRPVYYRQSYYAPSYYSGYRGHSRHYCPPQRSRGGLSFVIGF
jgi:hypothetical protein